MLESQVFSIAESYGPLGICLAIAIWVIVYAIRQNEWILQKSQAREERLIKVIEDNIVVVNKTMIMVCEDLSKHDGRSEAAIKRIEEASHYQREEHQKIMEIGDRTLLNMSEILTTLRLMNRDRVQG